MILVCPGHCPEDVRPLAAMGREVRHMAAMGRDVVISIREGS